MFDMLIATITAAVGLLAVLVLVRNEVVYKVLMRRLDEVYGETIWGCDALSLAARAEQHRRIIAEPEVTFWPYAKMVWDLRKWKYDDFYGGKDASSSK